MRLFTEDKPTSKVGISSGNKTTFRNCKGIWKGVVFEPEDWQFNLIGPVYRFDNPVAIESIDELIITWNPKNILSTA